MHTINYGVDLGTSNSCIAFAEAGKTLIFGDAEGKPIIASAVMYDKSGNLDQVGNDAYTAFPLKPECVAIRFKRAMGTNATFTLQGVSKPLRPEDLTAEVLKELKRLASLRGHHVEHAVVCTPAKFDSTQVDATNDAARLAGIIAPVLLSEPMAASYGYGLTSEKQGSWLVYDLGAGTFDAVVVQVRGGKMTIQNIDGANRLGGSDMDRIIWEEIVIPDIARQAGVPTDHQVFKDFAQAGRYASEKAKIRLSRVEKTEIATDEIYNHSKGRLAIEGRPLEITVSLTRSAIESKLEPLVDKSLEVCRRTLASFNQVSEVLLVGGPTEMPIVRKKLQALILPINSKDVHPMTAVATGAALYASTTPITESHPVSIRFASHTTETGKVHLQLDYEPQCPDTDAPVVVRCSDSRAGHAIIESDSNNWTSGRVPLNKGDHLLNVPIESRTVNLFSVKVYGPTGSLLECQPSEISIVSTPLISAAPPLPESLWLEVQNPDDAEKHEGIEIIKKNTPLPAKGSSKVRTQTELSRGSTNEVIVKIWEGNREYLRANRSICKLNLTGQSLSRKLPANSEIQISVRVDASRRIVAEAYIPLADETVEVPQNDKRMDTTNPVQLDHRRKWLASRIEDMEEENDSPDVRVSLELCRRLIFNEEVTKALRLAKQAGQDQSDASARVDEALREAEERLVILREKEKETIIPNEWHHERQHAEAVVNSALAHERDRQSFGSISAEGDSALERKRLSTLRSAIREVRQLRVRIQARHKDFWYELAKQLPYDARAYDQPEEARRTLSQLQRPRTLEQLRADVIRLIDLLPTGAVGGDVELATNITLG